MAENGKTGLYRDWIEGPGLENVCKWAKLGLSDEQIAKNMGISVRSFLDWQNRFPAFSSVQWITLWNLLFYYLLLITALLSLRFFRNKSSLLPLSIIILQTLLLLFMGHGESRFHTPIMPFVVMLSALFIANKYKHTMNE